MDSLPLKSIFGWKSQARKGGPPLEDYQKKYVRMKIAREKKEVPHSRSNSKSTFGWKSQERQGGPPLEDYQQKYVRMKNARR